MLFKLNILQFLQSPNWMPNKKKHGKEMEVNSLLGSYFRITSFPDQVLSFRNNLPKTQLTLMDSPSYGTDFSLTQVFSKMKKLRWQTYETGYLLLKITCIKSF
jgi:hypothetical protein